MSILLAFQGGGAPPEIFATGAAVLVLAGAGTAVLPVEGQGAHTIALLGAGTVTSEVAAVGATTLQLVGAGFVQTLADILASGATTIVLQGAGSAEVTDAAAERIAEYWRGGAGREEFQPRVRRQPTPVEAAGRAKLVLVGRGRATVNPELAAGITPRKRTPPLARPVEELREFRILARGRQKFRFLGTGEATGAVGARGRAHLALVGAGAIVKNWSDDTDELVAIMLMLDNDAA